MPTAPIFARDILFQISDGGGTPTWMGCAGAKNFKPSFSENEEFVDTTDFNSAGQYEGMAAQRGAKFDIEGQSEFDTSSGARDPGQARFEALAVTVGTASVGQVRWRYPSATVWTVWNVYISSGDAGGGHNDVSTFSYSVVKTGPATTMAV